MVTFGAMVNVAPFFTTKSVTQVALLLMVKSLVISIWADTSLGGRKANRITHRVKTHNNFEIFMHASMN
jgi:hypothetical protein